MPDLSISFNGMVLIGHGDRAEAWLIDTDRVQIGHDHRHEIRIGRERRILQGHLVTFESNGQVLGGPLDLGDEVDKMIDLDAVLEKPSLRTELLTDEPRPGGPWTDLLAAWLHLPGGTMDVRAEPFEVWEFPRSGARRLSEQCTLVATDVINPVVRIESPDGSIERIAIPIDQGEYRVSVDAIFTGPLSPFPDAGERVVLDEVLLLYACVTSGPAVQAATEAMQFMNYLPAKVFSEADVLRRCGSVTLSIASSVCPNGAKRLSAT